MRPHLDRVALSLILLAFSGQTASATWSISAVDTRTGEIAVASATCIMGANLARFVPVIRVGVGGGCTQASINPLATNKMIIWDELVQGTAPEQILSIIEQNDGSYHDRQFGLADLQGRVATFTGNDTLAWSGGVTGSVGTIHYAIQGNILTGSPVVLLAEHSFVNTSGDLAERLMAFMIDAARMGGDGRCSCPSGEAEDCGSPPAQFDKSAHIAFMFIARVGDPEGPCEVLKGCAQGDYYMRLNVHRQRQADPDPVFQLMQKFADWRVSWMGRPDHNLSTAELSECVLPSDGVSTSTLTIQMVDWQGIALDTGGASVSVTTAGDGAVSVGNVVDNGDGSYSVDLTAGAVSGRDELVILVDDGLGKPATLYPYPEIAVVPGDALSASVTQISASAGEDIGLSVAAGAGLAGRPYVILMSSSGHTPSFTAGKVTVPLVLDQTTLYSFQLCGSPILPNTCGVLDANGAAQAGVVLAPGNLSGMVGLDLSMALVTILPVDYASDPVDVAVVP